VVKFYDKCTDNEDPETSNACNHINNEILIYTHLNESSTEWPSHVPPVHYSGKFFSYNGSIISFVEGRTIKFSEMSPKQHDACETALRQLHQHNVLHGDIHYGNFIIDSNDKAFIIDFGYSELCDDEELFEKEIMLLKGKLQAGDNSVKQTFKFIDNEGNDELTK
jgi:serine/threonine protein kinase